MITIKITTDNAAFEDNGKDQEVYNILQEMADNWPRAASTGKVRDSNGNTVGSVTLTGKDRS